MPKQGWEVKRPHPLIWRWSSAPLRRTPMAQAEPSHHWQPPTSSTSLPSWACFTLLSYRFLLRTFIPLINHLHKEFLSLALLLRNLAIHVLRIDECSVPVLGDNLSCSRVGRCLLIISVSPILSQETELWMQLNEDVIKWMHNPRGKGLHAAPSA